MLNAYGQAPKDIEIASPPPDGISAIGWSPTADLLAGACWDNQVRIWEVSASGISTPKAVITHEQPALCLDWSSDGSKLVSGGCDKAARLMDMRTGQTAQIAAHDAPIRQVKFCSASGLENVVVTGSWDKQIKYWDTRSPNALASVTLPERVYSMDCVGQLLCVATADRQIHIINLQSPSTVFKSVTPPLKWQPRVVACFPDQSGYAVGSIEGRVAIQYINDEAKNFTFKCHRSDKGEIFPVNAISFHPQYGTFSTAGSDGTFSFWDKDSKQRLKSFNGPPGALPNVTSYGAPITATSFNRTGSIFAYTLSYDWSKGYMENRTDTKNTIMLHAVKDEDIKPKAKAGTPTFKK